MSGAMDRYFVSQGRDPNISLESMTLCLDNVMSAFSNQSIGIMGSKLSWLKDNSVILKISLTIKLT